MNLLEIPQKVVKQVDRRINKSTVKILLGIIFLGFIIITIVWLPELFHSKEVELLKTMEGSENIASAKEVVREIKEPFNFKETITWFIGTIQTLLLIALTIKKIFGVK